MTKITCPRCHQSGIYHCRSNFDTYVCDCGCEFFRKNGDYLIGKNPFSGSMIQRHHDPICPSCNKESDCDTVCDNSCGTYMCDCKCEFHVTNGKILRGHNPQCGM